MRELSLFSGAGGGLLGTKLLGWKCVGYVEFADYCQRIIKARIKDGIFDDAPIFGDIRAFLSEGYADSYSGLVDVVTAGFPCQPFSVAGRREGADDERNMWPQTIDVIRRVRPRYCLLENVPGLLSSGYMGTVFGDLAESGFDARWRVLSAGELGAPHLRKRLWIVGANTASERAEVRTETGVAPNANEMAKRLEQGRNEVHTDTECERREGRPITGQNPWAAGQGEFEGLVRRTVRSLIPAGKYGRMADGVSDRSHRLKVLGNGQVPAVVAEAWRQLT